MIRVQFKTENAVKCIYYDCDGWLLKDAIAKIPEWVLEEFPEATDIKVLDMLVPVGTPT